MIQDSPEWHAWRLSGIGASEIPSILGLCPYGGTPHKVWRVKTKRDKGFQGNSFTEHGKETEAKARARYELLNLEDMPPACATHPKYPFLLASLDGWNQETKRVLEIKCPKGSSTLDAALGGNVINHYVPQVQQQLLVTGADELDFFVFHDESKRDALVTVTPDLEMQARIIIAAEEFWKFVLTDTPPPLTDEDIKIIEDNDLLLKLSEKIIAQKDSATKVAIDGMKREFISIGGHPKVKCGRVLVSTVNRSGKFSYHKLTVGGEG